MHFQLTLDDERRWVLVLHQIERMRIAILSDAGTPPPAAHDRPGDGRA